MASRSVLDGPKRNSWMKEPSRLETEVEMADVNITMLTQKVDELSQRVVKLEKALRKVTREHRRCS